ncbi:hypothetical protein PV04_10371 [Phialophora macrospora]|uniref:Uncharacterized protein n=1 Tax=Phialophora macrospora TaxID=1851006 RepID=A0A0D2CAZ7_9EURO|nr:hypothetical protein PV04_10371 [Phialophora macrospora]
MIASSNDAAKSPNPRGFRRSLAVMSHTGSPPPLWAWYENRIDIPQSRYDLVYGSVGGQESSSFSHLGFRDAITMIVQLRALRKSYYPTPRGLPRSTGPIIGGHHAKVVCLDIATIRLKPWSSKSIFQAITEREVLLPRLKSRRDCLVNVLAGTTDSANPFQTFPPRPIAFPSADVDGLVYAALSWEKDQPGSSKVT